MTLGANWQLEERSGHAMRKRALWPALSARAPPSRLVLPPGCPVPGKRRDSVSADGPAKAPMSGGLPDAAELEAERQLCERARGGDRAALGQLLRSHGPRLFRAVL